MLSFYIEARFLRPFLPTHESRFPLSCHESERFRLLFRRQLMRSRCGGESGT